MGCGLKVAGDGQLEVVGGGLHFFYIRGGVGWCGFAAPVMGVMTYVPDLGGDNPSAIGGHFPEIRVWDCSSICCAVLW